VTMQVNLVGGGIEFTQVACQQTSTTSLAARISELPTIQSANSGFDTPSERVEPTTPPPMLQPVETPAELAVVPYSEMVEQFITPTVIEFADTISTDNLMTMNCMMPLDTVGSSSVSTAMHTQKQRKGKMQAPMDTSTLRRSNSNNKYDGFHVTQTTDSRPAKSKVKPRVIPSAATATEDAITMDSTSEDQCVVAPPPTPIPAMQAIGTHMCAIPAEELTISALSEE
jgi:hypothetical protein